MSSTRASAPAPARWTPRLFRRELVSGAELDRLPAFRFREGPGRTAVADVLSSGLGLVTLTAMLVASAAWRVRQDVK